MNSIIQSIREKNVIPGFSSTLSLPLSQSTTDVGQPPQPGLRRRLFSLSLRIQQQVPSPGASWSSFRRAKSVSSMGDYYTGTTPIRKWWEQGWSWIMSRKPMLARDLEMSEVEGRVLGAQNKGSLRHVLFKFRSEILKMVGSDNNVSLPR